MTWNDHHRRRGALDAAVEHARHAPNDLPTPELIPAARGVFTDADELLCALQYRWTQLLTGRLDAIAIEATSAPEHAADPLATVRSAWQRTADANPALRALLDHHVDPPAPGSSPQLREAAARERRMLARAAGLVETGDEGSDIARVGSAVRRLIRLPADRAETQLLAGTR